MPTLPRVVLRRCLDLGRGDGVGDAALGDDALRELLKKRRRTTPPKAPGR